jgi:Tol biopolymer transport system component/DNA-binding winged helix-turn-helix (wHTH) protein
MSEDSPIYAFDDFRLIVGERLLLRKKNRISLTPRAFDLLHTLVRNHGHLLEKEELLHEVWENAAVEEGNLNRTVSTLRRALGDPPGVHRYIETVPKVGYRFVGKVETVRNASPDDRAGRPRRRFGAVRRWVLIHLGIALVIALLVFAYNRATESGRQSAIKTTDTVPARITDGPYDHDEASWTSDGRVRFIRFEAGKNPRSFVANADGTDPRPENERIPALRVGSWSPDGRHVVFWKTDLRDLDAYLSDPDGKNEFRLPFRPANLNWSDDGKSFVYHAEAGEEAGRNQDIFRYWLDSRKSENLTNHPGFDADPSMSADGKKIAFVSDRNGNQEVFVMNGDGSGVRRITQSPARESFPVISPDGTQVAFNSNRENETVGIYVVPLETGGPEIGLSDPAYSAEIRRRCWSADGTRIVFTSNADGRWQVYSTGAETYRPVLIDTGIKGDATAAVYSRDAQKMAIVEKAGKGAVLRIVDMATKQTVTVIETENRDVKPEFSPDGRSLALNRKLNGNTDVWIVGTDGSDARNLTSNPFSDGSPSFSPDGRRIAFTSNRDGEFERHSLFVMNADGTDQKRITKTGGYEFDPVWSSDGTSIVFVADHLDGSSMGLDLSAVDAATGDAPIKILRHAKHDSRPAVSPDGKRIAFVSIADGNPEIYLVNIDGTGLLRLTRNVSDDLAPAWSPDGSRILFSSNRGGRFGLYEVVLPDSDRR